MAQPVNRWALRLAQPDPFTGSGRSPGAPGTSGGVAMKIQSGGEWHPTIVSLMVLIVFEIAAFAALRYAFRTAHGG